MGFQNKMARSEELRLVDGKRIPELLFQELNLRKDERISLIFHSSTISIPTRNAPFKGYLIVTEENKKRRMKVVVASDLSPTMYTRLFSFFISEISEIRVGGNKQLILLDKNGKAIVALKQIYKKEHFDIRGQPVKFSEFGKVFDKFIIYSGQRQSYINCPGCGQVIRFDGNPKSLICAGCSVMLLKRKLSERDLNIIISNFPEIVEDGLEFIEREKEYEDIGRLDVLCKSSKNEFVVIEIKIHETDDRVIGQLLRYMGVIEKDKNATGNVRGIIVADGFDNKLGYALKFVKPVRLVTLYDLRENARKMLDDEIYGK